jgi:hypothetical protein
MSNGQEQVMREQRDHEFEVSQRYWSSPYSNRAKQSIKEITRNNKTACNAHSSWATHREVGMDFVGEQPLPTEDVIAPHMVRHGVPTLPGST